MYVTRCILFQRSMNNLYWFFRFSTSRSWQMVWSSRIFFFRIIRFRSICMLLSSTKSCDNWSDLTKNNLFSLHHVRWMILRRYFICDISRNIYFKIISNKLIPKPSLSVQYLSQQYWNKKQLSDLDRFEFFLPLNVFFFEGTRRWFCCC